MTGWWPPSSATRRGPVRIRAANPASGSWLPWKPACRRLGTDYIDILYLHRSFDDAALNRGCAGARRPDPPGQDPVFRCIELRGMARRAHVSGRGRTRRGPARGQSAGLQHRRAKRGARGHPGIRPLRRRCGQLQPSCARSADRQIPARRRARPEQSRRAWRPADAADRVARRLTRDRGSSFHTTRRRGR